MRQDVINQSHFLWLLEHVANQNLGKVPIYQAFPIKDGKITDQVSDDQIMGYMIWMNLLETGDMNLPVPSWDMMDIIRGQNRNYVTLDRRSAMLESGVIDFYANIIPGSLERALRAWKRVSKDRPFPEV